MGTVLAISLVVNTLLLSALAYTFAGFGAVRDQNGRLKQDNHALRGEINSVREREREAMNTIMDMRRAGYEGNRLDLPEVGVYTMDDTYEVEVEESRKEGRDPEIDDEDRIILDLGD